MFSAGVKNYHADFNNIVFTIKGTKLYVPVVPLSAKDNQKLSKPFGKGWKDQCIGMNINKK